MIEKVFSEYIRNQLFHRATKPSNEKLFLQNTDTCPFKDENSCSCCVSQQFFQFVQEFFGEKVLTIGKSRSKDGLCEFGRSCGFTILDIDDEFFPFNPTVNNTEVEPVYTRLLCLYLGTIINDFLYLKSSQTVSIYLLYALQNIRDAYMIMMSGRKITYENKKLLSKVFFYVCLCVRGGNGTSFEFLGNCFSRIEDRNIADEILCDFWNAIYYQWNNEKKLEEDDRNFKKFVHKDSFNYLVCVYQFLTFVQKNLDNLKLDINFRSVLNKVRLPLYETRTSDNTCYTMLYSQLFALFYKRWNNDQNSVKV